MTVCTVLLAGLLVNVAGSSPQHSQQEQHSRQMAILAGAQTHVQQEVQRGLCCVVLLRCPAGMYNSCLQRGMLAHCVC
jgi:hypothetical protein